jgi:CubicO group peptidase (beta-lactamase class C family)
MRLPIGGAVATLGLAISVVGWIASPGLADDAAVRECLDRDIPGILAKCRVPSVSIAHIRGGKIVLVAAYGGRSPGAPATAHTLYNVASMTKPISAEVILRLASDGSISLDESMSNHWVDPDIAGDERRRKLTPRLALSHRTGFPNWRGQTGDVLRFIKEPGGAYGYSGEGYEYVARFAEKKTGAGFEGLAGKLVFEPAGMKDTAYTRRPWFKDRIAVPADANGKWLEPKIVDSFSAADDLYTTAADYAQFILGVMNRDGIGDDIARERESIQVEITKDSDTPPRFEHGMGLGWEIVRLGRETFLMHSGSDAGEYAFGYFSPTNRTGTVVLTNGAKGERLLLPILDRLGDDATLLKAMHARLE